MTWRERLAAPHQLSARQVLTVALVGLGCAVALLALALWSSVP